MTVQPGDAETAGRLWTKGGGVGGRVSAWEWSSLVSGKNGGLRHTTTAYKIHVVKMPRLSTPSVVPTEVLFSSGPMR